MASVPLASAQPAPIPLAHTAFGLGWGGLTLAYLLVFSLTGEPGPAAIAFALANVAPAALLGLIAARLIERFAGPGPWPVTLGCHLLIGATFIGGWYGLLIPARAVANWIVGAGFILSPLTGPALPWQLFQGLMIYVVVAVSTHAMALLHRVETPPTVAPPAMTRYLMRRGDDIRPVEVEAIISIRGADDYAEVTTDQGVHLARMTLAAFAETLPPRFVRVHRSWIINFDRLEKAEPTGDGRLLLHLDDGRTLTTSRAGAALLRRRLV